jgi:hypothetical protein
MGYVESKLQNGEEIKYKAKLHVLMFARPIVFFLVGWVLYGAENGVIHFIGIVFLLAGVLSLIRRTFDLLLTKCEGLHIKQSMIGRLFNFGTITVTTGGATSSYQYIIDLLAFRSEINTQIG